MTPTLTILKVEDDTIRIMLATDNHLGVNERDPIRGQDSLNTFKEILQLAVKHDVSQFHICQVVLSPFASRVGRLHSPGGRPISREQTIARLFVQNDGSPS